MDVSASVDGKLKTPQGVAVMYILCISGFRETWGKIFLKKKKKKNLLDVLSC